MKKSALSLVAVLLLSFYLFGFFRWLSSGHTMQDVLTLATSDWFLLVTLIDLALFALLCLIWLVRDMRSRNISSGKIIALILVCIISGMPPFLLYLAFRNDRAY